jgi:hypothetical protein
VAEDRRETIVPIVFDDKLVSTDLEHLTDAAGAALVDLRREVDRDGGLPVSRLKRCQAEGRDGTRLAGFVKTYVPWPTGPWGIVFRAGEDPKQPYALYTSAYGRRHPTGPGQRSVYEIADLRQKLLGCE